jgi:mannose-6-phosphate isomerase-like protein (cupin superfamily)
MKKPKKGLELLAITAAFFVFTFAANPLSGKSQDKAEKILKEFASDYAENDELPKNPLEFGIRITGTEESRWTISIHPGRSPEVSLSKGLPDTPTFVGKTDLETLSKIYRGEINALTAAGRARMSDKTPFDFEFINGFQPDPDFLGEVMLPVGFHFFTRGKPEVIPFGEEYSRFVHGGNAVIFYYQKGLRTGWYQIKKGMTINETLEDAVNPFPTLFVFIKGKGKGRLGDKTISLEQGMSVFVPAGMVHQFWTDEERGMEFIIIMFGEGA